jgi:hypothetical protein
MTQRRLIVAGCSFSDYLANNKTVYGQELATKLGCTYVHQGAGCGSNWRTWRVIGGMLLRGEITSNDLVVVQYTGMERREFWSRFTHKIATPAGRPTREPYDQGCLIRYKSGANTWQPNPAECDFFKTYEENHVSVAYEAEWFALQHYQFQLLLKAHAIPCIFITSRIAVNETDIDLIEPYAQSKFYEPFAFKADRQNWYSDTDSAHFCDHGHRRLADILHAHVNTLDL